MKKVKTSIRVPKFITGYSFPVPAPMWTRNYYFTAMSSEFRNIHRKQSNIKEPLTDSKFYVNVFNSYTPRLGPMRGWMNVVILRKKNKLFKVVRKNTKRLCRFPLMLTLSKPRKKIFIKILHWDFKKRTTDRIYLSHVQFVELNNTEVMKGVNKARLFLERQGVIFKSKKKRVYKIKRTNYW